MAGFDCSGLAIELLKAAGVLPHAYDSTAKGLLQELIKRGGQKTQFAGFGTICFYGKTPDEISHVTFALDRDTMLEAGGGGSSTTTLENAIKQNAFVRIRPILNRSDLVTMCNPIYKWN